MNEIFENDSVITRVHNFYNTYKALIIGIAVIVIQQFLFFLRLIKLANQTMRMLLKYTTIGRCKKLKLMMVKKYQQICLMN